jgi:hypothetical protein
MRTSRAVKNPVITMALTVATMVTTFAGANTRIRDCRPAWMRDVTPWKTSQEHAKYSMAFARRNRKWYFAISQYRRS